MDLSRAQINGTGIPVRGNDIDTDRIIPARFMKCVTFEGLGEYAFHDERFAEDGSTKDHSFNDERYRNGNILIVNKNFGCGSSREHAPQSLNRFGITAVIGESFAEIFAGNCAVMGIPAVRATENDVQQLMSGVEKDPSIDVAIDLEEQAVRFGAEQFAVTLPESARKALISGTWDTTAMLLANDAAIAATAARIPYMVDFAVSKS